MKGTGKVCIRILCAIFVGVVLGCSGGASGGGIGDGGSTGGNGGGGTGWKQPAYMNITEEFGGQQFLKLDNDVRWANDQNRDTNFYTSYKNAQNFLKNKLAELQKTVDTSNTGSLTNEINTLLNNYNTGTNISNTISNNFTALAPVIYNMRKDLSDNDFQDYQVSYYKLAHNAYQNSLGSIRNNTTLKANQEMLSDIYTTNFFAKELEKTNPKLSYNELNVAKARTLMNNNLSKISDKTGTDLAVLKKVIELASYNESLYGLNDYAKTENVNSYNKNLRYQHSITDLNDALLDYRNSMTNSMTRSIDDGTM